MLVTPVLRRDVIRDLARRAICVNRDYLSRPPGGIIKAPGKEPHARKENGAEEAWPAISRPSPAGQVSREGYQTDRRSYHAVGIKREVSGDWVGGEAGLSENEFTTLRPTYSNMPPMSPLEVHDSHLRTESALRLI